MNVGASLRDARKRAGLTQEELATRAGTSQASVSAYESGRKAPSVETLSRMLAATGSRLAVEAGRRPVVMPSARHHAQSSKTLVEVLGLAAALPNRYERELRFPRLAPLRPGRD